MSMSRQNRKPITDPRPKNNDEQHLDANALRDAPEVIQRIGPADDTPEETMQHLDEDGYDHMSENYYGSNPVTDSEQPDRWLNEDAVDRSQVTHHSKDADDADNIA